MSETLSNLRADLVSPPVKMIDKVRPGFYRNSYPSERKAFHNLLTDKPFIQVFDFIRQQLGEFIKISHPSQKFTEEALQKAITEHLDGCPPEEYGVWVYYPWNEKVVHLLDEKEFSALRTNRNLYKITPEERDSLSTKKIGVIGLSVGQSVAMTLAMERSFGELRIADFDTLDLSNMNRIRTGVHNLGIPKTVIVAREIAEIDPFLKVTCYPEGITENNIDEFLNRNGKLDLLIDECDSIDIKILCRQKARAACIPVLMDTSDRGMIDIERFDLEPEREILHGLLGGINYHELQGLTNEQKLPYILKIIDLKGLSIKSKVSALEIGQSIPTWPQLASSVLTGGAITANLCRRILTNQLRLSGRFYVDPETVISDPPIDKKTIFSIANPYKSLQSGDMERISSRIKMEEGMKRQVIHPEKDVIEKIVLSAGKAPSSGNDQPWKWLYSNGSLFLFHDIARSYSFGDYKNIGSYLSLGAAIENLVLSAHSLGLELSVQLFPIKDYPELVSVINFFDSPSAITEPHVVDDLSKYIDLRHTNRKITDRILFDQSIYETISNVGKTISGTEIFFVTDKERLEELGEIISATDRIRILDPHGHFDFFHREMRWTQNDALTKRDGMDIETLEIPKSALTALKMVADAEVIDMIRKIDGGQLFKTVSINNVVTASGMGLITMNSKSPVDIVNAGRSSQRVWLEATKLNIAFQPLIAPLYLFPRLTPEGPDGLSVKTADELKLLKARFEKVFPSSKYLNNVFLFRVFKADEVKIRSLRLPLEDILIIAK